MKAWLRFPPPLHVLVLLVVLALSGASLLVKVFVVDAWKMKRLIEFEKAAAENQTERLATLLAEGGLDTAAHQISLMQTYPLVNWAGVADPKGKIIHSTKPGWEGRMLGDASSPEVTSLVSRAVASREPSQLIREDENIFTVRAIPSNADRPLEFIVMVKRDLAKVIASRQHFFHRETLYSAVLLLGYSLLIWLVIFLFLRWRMRDFYRTTGLDNAGETVPLSLQGGDEFAQIAGVLGKAEHLLRDIADNLQEVVWIVTPDLQPAYLSPAFEKVFMRKREEAYSNVGAMPEYILKEYHDRVRNAFIAVLKGAPFLHIEYRILRGDGQIRWIEVRGFPVKTPDGTLLRVVGITRDITTQKSLQEELVNVSEQERHSLGHDLHDDACQRLAAIKLKSETLASELKSENSPHSATAAELTGQIAGTSALLRNIARGLTPVEVEGDGLVHALDKLVLMQEAIHEVPCFFTANRGIDVSNKFAATHLYRIAQELISNAARHAKPERIDVKLESLDDYLRLTVTNDGLPFQTAAPDHHGMGLKIMRYRASAIGATIDIRPRTDGITGTVAECLVSHDICQSTPAKKGNLADDIPVR